jgi:hypothetical protein
MSNEIKARKTEYCGVQFKSKSEAIFARALHILGYLWAYEPEHLRWINGYVPDFIVSHLFSNTIIEYKPKMPTATYIENMKSISYEICREHGIPFIIVVIDPYNCSDDNEIEIIQLWPENYKSWTKSAFHRTKNNLKKAISQAMEYRYDLERVSKTRPFVMPKTKTVLEMVEDIIDPKAKPLIEIDYLKQLKELENDSAEGMTCTTDAEKHD